MGILHSILEYINPRFAMIRGTEIHYYNLKEAENVKEVTLSPTQLGSSGVTVVDSEGKTRTKIDDITISLSSQSGQIDLSQALNNHLTDALEAEKAVVYLLKDEEKRE